MALPCEVLRWLRDTRSGRSDIWLGFSAGTWVSVSIIPSIVRIQSSIMQQMKNWSTKGAFVRGNLFTKLLVQDIIEEKEMK